MNPIHHREGQAGMPAGPGKLTTSPAVEKHFDVYRHSPRRRQSVDKLAAREREAEFLRGVGEACPMSWFANSPLYWNLLLVDSDYQPPYLRPAPAPVVAQLELAL